jgi:putative PIN family toxin of toxin-antitoxin system
MKVVPDTMMWASYATRADGPRAQAIDRALRSRVRLFTSDYILDEVERVLGEYQSLPRAFVRRTVRAIRRLAEVVELPEAIRSHVSNDPNDNPIVQTAISGKADFVLTADKTMLDLGKVQDVEIFRWLSFTYGFRRKNSVVDRFDANGGRLAKAARVPGFLLDRTVNV